MKSYEVTYVCDLESAETDEHTLKADVVEIKDGCLCFYKIETEPTGLGILRRKKMVMTDAYGPGIWVAFFEYEDTEDWHDDGESMGFEFPETAFGEAARRLVELINTGDGKGADDG